MFYFGLVLGLPVGFLAAVAFPGVISKLRAGYFAKVRQAENVAKGFAEQVQRGL